MKPIRIALCAIVTVGVVFVQTFSAAEASQTPAPDSSRPNIVVVLIDTFRASFVPIYGGPKGTMPFLTELAEEATVFNRAFSTSSWTAPATSSLFTSTYPTEHGIKIGMAARQKLAREVRKSGAKVVRMTALPKRLTTMPEALHSLGYATFAVASNLNVAASRGFHRGFDQFQSMNRQKADALLAQMATWKDEIEGDKPFFLYFHFNDCHSPYEKYAPFYKPKKGLLADARASYLSAFSYMDTKLREIHETYVKDKNTIFVLVSDHGEEFREHGGLMHEGSIYDELNRVVMVFSGPEEYVSPGRINENVSLIDVMPTLLEIAGAPANDQLRGTSLLPVLRGDEEAEALRKKLADRILFAERSHPLNHDMELWAAIHGPWKLINKWDERLELYNHDVDEAEQRNVMVSNIKKVDFLQQAIKAAARQHVPKLEDREDDVDVTMDEEMLQQLEALGYVE